jgi:D-alanyl-D-alanine carboxypeptidase/D-alanyl-D-alanine-endopeptidase (penicillin-binding protein 4)
MVIILTGALAIAAPLGSKTRKTPARAAKAKSAKAKKAVAKRSRGRVAKASSRKARSSKVAARKSKRGSRVSSRRAVYARGRGKKGRKWRGTVARSKPTYHRSGIHNFLTESWVKAQSNTATEPAATPNTTGGPAESAGPSLAPATSVTTTPVAPAAEPSDHQAGSDVQAGPAADIVPLNPLVEAYSSSLAARGYEAENQGFILETLDGEVLAEHNADRPFNPASVVKVATSLVAISKLGPDFRFRTSLYTDGVVDSSTGTLNGSLYVIGSGDPAFFYENALLIADQLNRNGIRSVNGNLVVLGQFYFNLSASREASARVFRNTLTPETWDRGVKSAYPRFLSMRPAGSRKASQGQYAVMVQSGPPSLKISGETITNPAVDTTSLKLLAVHTSLPLVRLLKGLNDFSNNWMASVIGNLVGGPDAVQRFLSEQIGLKEEELNIVTASGLGSNFISPRGTIHILRKLITYLDKEHLKIEDILPIAGIDKGTLERRFTDAFRGAVVGKTGTLSSVSALAGVAYTRTRGPLLFVIYNRGGSVSRFRAAQDETIKKVITFFGGPVPVRYSTTGGAQVSQQPAESQPPTAQSSPK